MADNERTAPVANGSSSAADYHEKTIGLFRNTISLAGAALAAVSLANIIFLILLDSTSGHPSPYIGMFAYMVIPGFLVLGLLLIPIGMLLERNRRRHMAPDVIPAFPKLDLNREAQRSAVAAFLVFVVIFVAISALGSYRAYEFTDSVQFCGQLCHSVMNPEFVAYKQSPHARVACVECHVGAGAGWYVKSKLSGARQVLAVMRNSYPRPIPSPVANLRPAQETCEQCHWPRKFYGAQLKIFTHFANDEKNTPRQIRMLIKVGGGDPSSGVASGIHWHMNIGNQITYAVTDPKHQVIPWVQIKDQQGHVTVYKAKDSPVTDAQIEAAPKRRMDCVDCHNRPTHIYVPPDRSVDDALLGNRIDRNLPFIKQQAVTVLTADYKSDEEASQGIQRGLMSYYSSTYPDVVNNHKAALNQAIAEVQRIYSNSIFPVMHVDWRTHPNNVGHYYFPGCFRCHDNNHVSAEGKVITQNCNSCHEVLGQEQGEAAPMGQVTGVGFNHPGGELPEGVSCADCHTGAVGP
jgi:nitrate/TMAO reductase-like tetraheme cytochrome c subunit